LLTNFIGTGSDKRRKAIIGGGYGDKNLFRNMRREAEERFSDLVQKLQKEIDEATKSRLAVIVSDLDTLRNENVALESERDPALRNRIASKLASTKIRMRSLLDVVNTVRG
jgi:hypothetical protein